MKKYTLIIELLQLLKRRACPAVFRCFIGEIRFEIQSEKHFCQFFQSPHFKVISKMKKVGKFNCYYRQIERAVPSVRTLEK